MVAVRKTSRIEWGTPKKARFRALVESAGWSHRQAAKEVGVPRSTATKWLKQISERRSGKDRSGRPPLISEDQLEAIDKWFPGYFEHRTSDLQTIINYFELRCSEATLYRALLKLGYHSHIPETKEWLSPKNKAERL